MRKNWFLWVLVLILGALIFWKPEAGWQVRGILVDGFWDSPVQDGENLLVLENENLRAKILELQDIKEQLPERNGGDIQAMVYTSYPFNLKDELLINVGRNQGVKAGRAVVVSGRVLIGKVEKVFERTSLIRTLFDSRWRSSVRIGEQGVEALLEGGSRPKLTLISKEAVIGMGSLAYSTDPEFTYGLPLGEVMRVGLSRNKLFQEADLVLGYDLGQVRTVLVINE